MHRPSFLRSSSSLKPPPSSSSSSASSSADPPTAAPPPPPHLAHPLPPTPSTRASLTASFSKSLAALAGTAATVGGNVGAYAKAAVGTGNGNGNGGGGGRGEGAATAFGGEPGGWRDAMAGWVGRKRSNSWIGKDKLVIFPGWAVQRPLPLPPPAPSGSFNAAAADDAEADGSRPAGGGRTTPGASAASSSASSEVAVGSTAADDPVVLQPFEIRLQLSLFASSSRPESAASRTQRIFTRMARSFADLPRIPPSAAAAAARAGSTRAGSPGRGEEGGEEEEGESRWFRALREERERKGDRTLSASPEPLPSTPDGGARTPTNDELSGKLFFADDDGRRPTTEPEPAGHVLPRSSSPSSSAKQTDAASSSAPAAASITAAAADPVRQQQQPTAPGEVDGGGGGQEGGGGSWRLANHRSASVGSAAPPVVSSSPAGPHADEALPPPHSQASTSSSSSSSSTLATASSSSSASSTSSAAVDDLSALARRGELEQMHATLRARLQPFFASVIPFRAVRIDVRPLLVAPARPARNAAAHGEPGREAAAAAEEPLWSRVVETGVNGTWDGQIVISWADLTSSPSALDLIFPDRLGLPRDGPRPQWTLEVTATLLQPDTGEPIADSAQPPRPSASRPLDNGPAAASSVTAVSLDRSLAVGEPPENPLPVVARRQIPLAGHKGIRVISDLDDTVKRTDLVGGLREVFRNVFCRDVAELEVEGMSALYRSLVPAVNGFHYVSNSPLELFEPIHSFLHANAFPAGFSLKLKFYGGRSLFHGLWEPAGERKARGVLEILEGFPDSQFVMFGDSAEQDLDLYTQIALERPHQVLGIFIRDVSARPASKPPTGLSSMTPLDSSAASIASSSTSSSSSSSTTPTTTGGTTTPAAGGGRSRSSTLDSTRRLVKSSIPSALRSGTASPRPTTSRSRSSSLLRGTTQPTTATGRPVADFEAAEVALKLEQAAARLTATAGGGAVADDQPPGPLSGPSERAALGQATAAPGELSEDVLDPLYADLPPSPQLTPTIVSAAQDGGGAADELLDEAVSSARAKALRRADEFRERFRKSRKALRKLGVVVEKFRRVDEVEELVRDLVNGRPLRR